jgi:uncharacterized protein
MSEQLQKILAELRARLEELYGERLERLVLFGSQARGDAEPDSDIDVLVVLKGELKYYEEIERTGDIMSEVSLKYDTVIIGVWVSSEEYAACNIPLLRNVYREGIAI